MKKFLFLSLLLPAFSANAITFHYSELNKSAKICTLASWSGEQPTSGKLVVPDTYQEEGVTYKVAKIAPHALDNLTSVTEITIGANVINIGEASVSIAASSENFVNCPSLALFKVAAGNTAFSATGAGILVTRGGQKIIRVPAAISLSAGELKMSTSVSVIYPDAFSGNSTIISIALSPQITSFESNCGFNTMTQLHAFSVNGSNSPEGFYVGVDGVLYDSSRKQIISFPPGKLVSSFVIPQSVLSIGERAFMNTTGLYNIDFANVTSIGKEAFRNCGIVEIELPYRDIAIGQGAFRDALRLASMLIPSRQNLPRDFARNCKALKTVTLLADNCEIGTSAFRDCTSLANFSFRSGNILTGDSIFSNCGFKVIEFSTGTVNPKGFLMGEALFEGNRLLESIDMSGMLIGPGGEGVHIAPDFTANCPLLTSIKLPRYVRFDGCGDHSRPNFGDNSKITHIEMGAFTLDGINDSPLDYSEGDNMPEFFMKTTGAPHRSWPLRNFFFRWQDASLCPIFYCEGYDMQTPDSPNYDPYEFVYPGGVYYIPGATYENYKRAATERCTVQEMYDLEYVDNNGKLAVLLTSRMGTLLEWKGVSVNGSFYGNPDSNGMVYTTCPTADATTLKVEYMVKGVSMLTEYPIPQAAGINGLSPDSDSLILSRIGESIIFSTRATFSIYNQAGALVASGLSSDSADITSLPAGTYILSARTTKGTAAQIKFLK